MITECKTLLVNCGSSAQSVESMSRHPINLGVLTVTTILAPVRSLWLLLALLALLTTTVSSEASSSISNSVIIASCRAACLHVFTSPKDDRDVKCRKNSDCFMCWNSCGVLQHQMGLWGSMCADHTACLPGCQVACGFYLSPSRNAGGVKPYMIPPPPPLPAYQPPPRITGGSQVVWGALDWSGSVAPSRDDIIYVLFLNSGNGWREVVQTSSRSTHMPPGVTGNPRLRLLAVTQEGIVSASDIVMPDEPTHHGSVEYTVEDLSSASAENVPDIATSSLLPDHTYTAGPQPEASESIVSEFYPYEDFESKKVLSKGADMPVLDSIVDPTWALQVVSVKAGIMAEVKVVWDARGPEGIEYLLSWVEETGGVSGHLLTDQLSTDVSLWPGQGYYLQVELVDSQGNPVMKSLATPVLFKTTTANTPTTQRSTSPIVVNLHTSSSTTQSSSSLEDSNLPVQDDAFSVIGTFISKGALPPGTPRAQENLQDDTDNAGSLHEEEYIPAFNDNTHTRMTTLLDTGSTDSVPEKEGPSRGIPPVLRNGSSTGVSSREIPTLLASDKAEEEALWYVGVSIGVLLVLILCSLVVWSLSRCRKVPRNEQYIEDSLNGVRASFREDVIRRHRNNPQTSWTFEKCNSTREDPRLESQSRKENNLPIGIDNASVIENYLLMLDSRPPKKKPRH